MPTPITRNVILISGFLQRGGTATNGMDRLWHRIHSEISAPDTRVMLCSWRDDFAAIARQIDMRRLAKSTTVDVIAYSWGVGYGAVSLAKHLRQYGQPVNRLYSIDGVYRHWTWIRSMFSRYTPLQPTIRLPWNVLHTTYWRQVSNRPMGHQIVGTLDSQIIVPGNADDGIVPANHQQIDNYQPIHQQILAEVTA